MSTAASTFRLTFLLLAFAPACARSGADLNADDPRSPLLLVRSIPLPDVRGRIDHLAYDGGRNRLFVAEYANGSVDEVDLTTGRIAARIAGLGEPQGIMWLAREQELVVACKDGSLRFYRRADRKQVARIDLGADADNVRVDPRNGNLVVGYGSGGLAVVDPAAHRVLEKLELHAHPEAFGLIGSRVMVNLPDAHEIAVADLDRRQIITVLDTGKLAGNYPMALDPSGDRIAVAYRAPGTLSVIDSASGATIFSVPACGDADDLYFRATQIVIVCGQGAIELIEKGGKHRSIRVSTRSGTRTGLLIPEQNALFVAVPTHGREAAIWQLAFR